MVFVVELCASRITHSSLYYSCLVCHYYINKNVQL